MLADNFSKFAKSNRINSIALDQYKRSIKPKGMTPMVIEQSQLNASTISVFDRLMMDKIIFLGEEIDDTIANIINAQLLFLESEENNEEPIWLYINSPGGDCYSGLAIYDTMQMIKAPVYTCVMGLAASMAYVLSIAGEKKHRYALPHSRLMMHQPWGGPGAVQATDLEIYNVEMQELKTDLITIIAQHTKKDKETVRVDAERDMWFTAKRAQEYGAIDKILTKL
jgi:ATP-dependent Clp protease, protease subunit